MSDIGQLLHTLASIVRTAVEPDRDGGDKGSPVDLQLSSGFRESLEQFEPSELKAVIPQIEAAVTQLIQEGKFEAAEIIAETLIDYAQQVAGREPFLTNSFYTQSIPAIVHGNDGLCSEIVLKVHRMWNEGGSSEAVATPRGHS